MISDVLSLNKEKGKKTARVKLKWLSSRYQCVFVFIVLHLTTPHVNPFFCEIRMYSADLLMFVVTNVANHQKALKLIESNANFFRKIV